MRPIHHPTTATGTFPIYVPPSGPTATAGLLVLRLVQALAAFGLALEALRRVGLEPANWAALLAGLG